MADRPFNFVRGNHEPEMRDADSTSELGSDIDNQDTNIVPPVRLELSLKHLREGRRLLCLLLGRILVMLATALTVIEAGLMSLAVLALGLSMF